ncbi:MAG: fatty acid desaturase family protein [Bacteriovoracia bacterium]
MKASSALTKEEIKSLTRLSNSKGFQAVLTTWFLIAGSFALCIYYPSILSYGVALVILGGRHLALAILMHDASHYSLFRTRWMNDFFGKWFCAYPTWQDLKRYRVHHMSHHKFAGSNKDPDLALVAPFPVSKKSLVRKLIRDIVGISGLRRIYGIVLMDIGRIQYTVSSDVVWLDQKERSIKDISLTALKNLHGVFITNLILYLVLHLLGHSWLYLLWVGSYLTTFSLFLRVRSIAEHACTRMGLDALDNTRTTAANLFARLTVAPHYVNYHLEHHIIMTVPSFNFKKMHKMLLERGALENAFLADGYIEVLKQAVK